MPKTVYYRNNKNLDQESFLIDLQRGNLELESNNPDENYQFITKAFIEIVERHLPLKKIFIKGNEAPVMSKEQRKAIYNSSWLRKFFVNIQSEEMKSITKRNTINVCLLEKKSIQLYFQNILRDGIITNKDFWSTMKPSHK